MTSTLKNYLFILIINMLCIGTTYAQCKISNLKAVPTECTPNGVFYVEITFDHSQTTNQFTIQGNGKNYGTFSYSNLPIRLGPLDANCTTAYEFVVRDVINTSCLAFTTIGTKCCQDLCDIAFKNVTTGTCDGILYEIALDILHKNTPTERFDLYTNGQFFNSYAYDLLPLTIEKFPSSNNTTFNEIVICANEKMNCCDTIQVLNPCVCSIYDIKTQVVECRENDKNFDIKIDFKHNVSADSFSVGGNMSIYGKFAYADLPITLKNIAFSPTIEYEFLIIDDFDVFCFGSYQLGIVNECDFECSISDVKATVEKCSDGQFYANLSFQNKNGSLGGFYVRGNGENYGSFEYGKDSYKIGPFDADCITKYEFIIIDNENEMCKSFTVIDEPVCCESVCYLKELAITEKCENNILQSIDIQFLYGGVSEKFELYISNKLVGTYTYSSLPINISNQNFKLSTGNIVIKDAVNTDCVLEKAYSFGCMLPACKIYDMVVEATECDDDMKFYGILKFKVTHPESERFIVVVDGVNFDTLSYGKDLYEIGPIMGDCTTRHHFLIRDLVKPTCAADFRLAEAVCCNSSCSISEPSISYSTCTDGKFELLISFTAESIQNEFNIILNGEKKGPYLYSSLPITLSNLESNTTYQMTIQDGVSQDCKLSFVVPAIACPSNLNDAYTKGLTWYNDERQLYVTTSSPWNEAKISIFDINGKPIILGMIPTEQKSVFDISTLPSGMYFFELNDKKRQLIQKWVKVNY